MAAPLMPENASTTAVISAVKFQTTELFYQTASLNQPVDLIVKRGHLGNTSSSILFNLKDLSLNKTLLTAQVQSVGFDSVSKKSAPLSKEFKRQFGTPNPLVKPMKIEIVKHPANAFCTEFRVVASDTDHLYHVNHMK